MNIFTVVLINPILNILVAIYSLLTALHVPSAVGFSIILLTILIRLILSPFLHQSLKQQKKMQQLTPHINKLKEKHKNDAKRLQMEQMALFKEHGVNPAAGCLVMLIQIPILFGLYQVLYKVIRNPTLSDINSRIYFSGLRLEHLWDTTFFGIPLAHPPSQLIHQVGFGIIGVSILTGGLQLIQSKMMMLPKAEQPKKEKNEEPDFATTFATQSTMILPIMVGFFSYSLPFGLSLYWNTLTIFGIIQQYIIQRFGGLVDWFPFLNKKQDK